MLEFFFKRIHKHSGFKRYFKNTTWLLGGQIFRMGLGLFVSVAVARHLGPGDFGLYNYVLSIVLLVGVVGQLGLQQLAKRELVESPERHDEIMGTCFVLNLLAGVTIYAVMLIFVATQTDRSLVLGLFALLGSSLLLSPLSCIELWFQSQLRSDLSVLATSISLALFAGLKVHAIIKGAGLITFGYLFIFEAIVLCLLQVYFYRKHFGSIFQWQIRWPTALSFLHKSWPLILSGLAVTVYMRIDQIMLGAMLNEKIVGEYSVAVRISALWYFIPSMLATSLFPAILNARKHSVALYEKRLQAYFDLNAGLAYVICLPLSLAAPWVVAILFGAEYAAAAPILAIHTWSSLFVFLGVARGQYLVAEQMFKFSMYCTVTGAFVNIFLNYYLIPIFGGPGAAIATLSSQILSAFISSFAWKGTRNAGLMQLASAFLFFRLRSIYHSSSKS